MKLVNAGMNVKAFCISETAVGERDVELTMENILDYLDDDDFLIQTRYLQGIQLSILAHAKVRASDPVTITGINPLRGPVLIFKGPELNALSDFEIGVIRDNIEMDREDDSYRICLNGVTMKPSKWKIVEGNE